MQWRIAATQMAEASNDAVQNRFRSIGKVSRCSKKISQITDTIEGIAFRAPLLALSAAAASARLGEQGLRFYRDCEYS